MARTAGSVIENQWTRGLITEATGLNFPEHAATDADNVRFNPKGSVSRRMGIDIESNAKTVAPAITDGVIKEYVWKAVAKNGGYTFLVMQKGSVVHFFELEDSSSLSAGIHNTFLDLEGFKAPGAGDIRKVPCSFDAGFGYLFIAHPHCTPVLIRWNDDTKEFEYAGIPIQIRDFEGVDDGLGITENPSTLTDEHHYNLKNQGWDQQVRVGNVTNEVGEGGSNSPIPPSNPLEWNSF